MRLLANKGHAVTAWSALPEEVEALASTRRHPKLPGMVIPESVTFTGDIAAACREKDAVIFAVPSPYVRATARAAAPFVAEDQIIVDVAKGMEAETLMTLTGVIGEEMRSAGKAPRLVTLSGPTHAEEVARDLPTTIVSASPDAQAAARIQDIFMTDSLRVLHERGYSRRGGGGGAEKRHRPGGGHRRRSWLWRQRPAPPSLPAASPKWHASARPWAAPKRRSAALPALAIWWSPARACTAATTAAACSSARARLRTRPCARWGMVVEGLNALPAALKLGKKYGVELPIIEGVHQIVDRGVSPRAMVGELMRRERKPENWM